MKTMPAITKAIAANFSIMVLLPISSLTMPGSQIELNKAIRNTSIGWTDVAKAATRVTGPFRSASPEKINEEKSTSILKPSRLLIFDGIILKVWKNSFLIDGAKSTKTAVKLASLNHKKALQNAVIVNMYFEATAAAEPNMADKSMK